jgi:uncharacterized membrane protein YidH (DUF202 family)
MDRKSGDTGLQVERTALAWLRTGLAIVVVALVAFRFTAHHSLPLALGVAAVIAPLGLVAIWLAWRRYRTSAASLATGKPLPGGVLPATMTAVAVLTGALGLAYALLSR